jgi:hypothetical protein
MFDGLNMRVSGRMYEPEGVGRGTTVNRRATPQRLRT